MFYYSGPGTNNLKVQWKMSELTMFDTKLIGIINMIFQIFTAGVFRYKKYVAACDT